MQVVVLQIHLQRVPDLLQVREAGRLPRLGPRLGKHGKEDRGKNGKDGYHDEQLDQREGWFSASAHGGCPSEIPGICRAVRQQTALPLRSGGRRVVPCPTRPRSGRGGRGRIGDYARACALWLLGHREGYPPGTRLGAATPNTFRTRSS